MTAHVSGNAPELADAGEGWFSLRAAAIWAAIAMPICRIVAPGVRGNARHGIVDLWQLVSAWASYAMALLLGAAAIATATRLLRKDAAYRGLRGLVVTGSFVTMALVVPAFARRLPSSPSTVLVLAASIVVVSACARAMASRATRAVAIVLALFGVAALVRLFGWQLAVAAGEQVSGRLYDASRVVASLAVVIEAAGQLAAVAWLGTRRKLPGQILASGAVVLGFGITWAATLGVHHDASWWQSMLHTALIEAPGLPAPFGLAAVATFLFAASFPLALVSAFRMGDDGRLGAVLTLALVSHGAFDAPLRALAAVVAAGALLSLTPLTTKVTRAPNGR